MRILATVTLALGVASFCPAATVTVLRPDGGPAATAVVLCAGHEKEPVLTGEDGAARVPDDCRAATCMAGAYISGRAELVAGRAVCRLIEGVHVTLRLIGGNCGEYCFGALIPAAREGDRVSRTFDEESDSGQPQAQLGVVRTGAYTVELRGDPEEWVCRMSVELQRTGEETIDAWWRRPFELRGVVIGEDGAPAADVPVRVRIAEAAAHRPPGAWACMRRADAPDLFSAEDGSFVVPVDPATTGLIDAGSSWDPDGFASVEIAPPWPSSITLRMKRRR